MKIYYFGPYNVVGSKYKRRSATSAIAKINYILYALNQAGYYVDLISSSYILENRWCFAKGGKTQINKMITINLSPGFGYKTVVGKIFSLIFTISCILIKLLKIKATDTLIVYHGNWYSKYVLLAKRIKKFQLIVEVEEIYTYAFKKNIKELRKELYFINSADKLLLVNDLLQNYLKFPKEKTLISYGPYQVSANENVSFKDDKIHLVYAGSFSLRKSGAQSAIAAANYLPEQYVMHILGFGDNETTNSLLKQITIINKTSKCKVVYEGEKRGIEYEKFMKSCHIGLCTQKLSCDYTLYAFPSKVLAYFGFGLNVVTAPLVALSASSINDFLTYYKEDSPQAIAEAIINAKRFSKETLWGVIKTLNDTFVAGLKQIIETK